MAIDISKPITVSIMNGTSYVSTFNFLPLNCNGNTSYYLKYINKWGVWDYLNFQGKEESSFSPDYEIYKYNDTSSFSYNTQKGLYHKAFTNGRVKTILNTGWLNENYNDNFKDLLLSEVVLLNGTDPVIIIDKEIKFKTIRFDKLINYTITIEKAYDEINKII